MSSASGTFRNTKSADVAWSFTNASGSHSIRAYARLKTTFSTHNYILDIYADGVCVSQEAAKSAVTITTLDPLWPASHTIPIGGSMGVLTVLARRPGRTGLDPNQLKFDVSFSLQVDGQNILPGQHVNLTPQQPQAAPSQPVHVHVNVSQEQHGGGAVINAPGGDMVGGDKMSVGNISGSQGVAIGHGASASVGSDPFAAARQGLAGSGLPSFKQKEAETAVAELEAQQGQAEPDVEALDYWLDKLLGLAPEVAQVLIDSLTDHNASIPVALRTAIRIWRNARKL